MTRPLRHLLCFLLAPWIASAVAAADPPAQSFTFEPTVTGATAAAYCMAKHPYQILDSQRAGLYTKDGDERLIAQKTVVIPSPNGLFVLQMNADAPTADAPALQLATAFIDQQAKISP